MTLPPNSTDEHIQDLNQKQIFVRDALPCEWLSYAEELGEAAEALWLDREDCLRLEMGTQPGRTARIEKTCGHSRSYILLAGLALENVLKAMLVARDPSLINSGTLAKSLKSHCLIDLADRIPVFDLDENEMRVLQISQDAIPYWGRYPVPLKFDGLKAKEAASVEFRDIFRRLHFRLCKDVYDAIKDGWDSRVGPETYEVRSTRYGDQIDLKKPFPWAKDKKG